MRGLRLCAAGGGGAPPRKTPDALAGRCFCGGWQVTYQKTERPLNVGKVSCGNSAIAAHSAACENLPELSRK